MGHLHHARSMRVRLTNGFHAGAGARETISMGALCAAGQALAGQLGRAMARQAMAGQALARQAMAGKGDYLAMAIRPYLAPAAIVTTLRLALLAFCWAGTS